MTATGLSNCESSKWRDVRVGIIGCGGIADAKHLPGLSKLENVRIVGFCDILPERARAAKEKYGTEDAGIYADYREILQREDIEVVHVLTPNSSHAEITIAALQAGKHVMCEKPMATSFREAQAMVAAAETCGKYLTIGYQTRSQITHQFVRRLIERGGLGEIYYIKAPAIRRRGVPLWGVFLDKEKQGGGPMIDIGTHSIDAALSLIDNYDVKSVTGSVYRKLADTAMNSNEWGIWKPEEFQVEDAAMGYVKFADGATMVVETSWALNYASEAHLTLCGTKGGVEFIDDETVRLNGEMDGSLYINDVRPNSTARDLFHGEKLTAEEYEAKQWIYSVINRVPPLTKPEQTCVVSHIIEAIYESAATGKTVYF